jgi:hypothetical protein
VTNIDIGTVGGIVNTQKGPVIIIMHQYALLGTCALIHSPCQFEWFKNDVNDKLVHTGGLQCIKTLDGYILPLSIKDGLACLKICPYTDNEWDTLPHMFLTSKTVWDPSMLDHDLEEEDEQWMDALSDLEANPLMNLFNEYGDYCKHVEVNNADNLWCPDENNIKVIINQCVLYALHSACIPACYDAHQHDVDDSIEEVEAEEPSITSTLPQLVITTKKPPDYEKLRPLFGWLSMDIIKEMFAHMMQYACLPYGTLLKCSFKSANPTLNVV